MFALIINALPGVKSTPEMWHVVDLVSYLQGKEQRIPLGFFELENIFCLSY